MRNKHILNHHKIKRKLDRNVSRWSRLFSLRKKIRRDYSWKGKQNNPYRTEKNNSGIKIKIIIIVFGFLSTFLLCIYSSAFAISDIQIEGLQRIDKTEVHEAIQGILDYKKFGIIPQRSYFWTDVSEIRDIIKDRFPIEKIIVKKEFPNHIFIVIEEKISTLIYDNEKTYSYIDLDGKVVEIMRNVSDYEWDEITEIVTSTNEIGEEIQETHVIEKNHKPDVRSVITELGNYPVIYDMRRLDVEPQQQLMDPSEVKTIITWYNALTKTTDITPKLFVIENEIGDLTVDTFERWYIKSRIARPVDSQIGELTYLLREKIDREKLNYIDMRYADRVYWK